MTDEWLAEYIDKVLSAGPGSAGDYIYIPIVCDYTF